MSIVPTPESDRIRFWAKVEKTPTCWLWTAALFEKGYGAFRLGGKQRRAHVVAHEWLIGPTNGLQVCHTCDVRQCVRPDHLFLGTQSDNIRDAVSKQRMAAGLRNGMHAQDLTILTDTDVQEIHALLEAGALQVDLASKYGVSQTLISHIGLGTVWKHLGLIPIGRGGKARPSPEVVRAVRAMAALGIGYPDIGRKHDMSTSAVWRIVNRLAYADIE